MKKFKSVITTILAIFFILTAFEAKAEFKLFAKKEESAIKECRKLYEQKTKESWQKAYEVVCSELARNGNGEAQYYVGMMLKEANQLKDNKAMAYSFFYVANENGEKRAKSEMEGMKILDMGVVYEMLSNIYYSSITKHNMIKDDIKSFEFLEKSSGLGSSSSQDDLCVTYALGFHGNFKFQKDYIQAYKWCYLASLDPKIKADKKSQQVFAKLKSLMTKDQIQQGQKLAKEWIKNNPDLINNYKTNSN